MSTKVAAPTATSTWVRKPPPRCRYWRSAPISVPSTKAANRLTSESRKSGNANERMKAIVDQDAECDLNAKCDLARNSPESARPREGGDPAVGARKVGALQLDSRIRGNERRLSH